MVKNYKQFESLLNKLQGPTYDEIKQNYLNGEINILNFYAIAKKYGEEQEVYDEIIKRLLTRGNSIRSEDYIYFCHINDIKPEIDVLKKMLFIGRMTLNDYVFYTHTEKEPILTHNELEEYFNSEDDGLKEYLKHNIGEIFNFCVTNKIQEGIDWFYNNGGSVIFNKFKEKLNRLSKTYEPDITGTKVVYKNSHNACFYYNASRNSIGFTSLFIREISSAVNENGNLIHIRKNFYTDIIKYFLGEELNVEFRYTTHF